MAPRWRRRQRLRLPVLLVALLVGAASCGSVSQTDQQSGGDTRSPGTTLASDGLQERASAADSGDGPADGSAGASLEQSSDADGDTNADGLSVALPTSPLADRVEQLPTALDIPEGSTGPTPTSMTFEAIGVAEAPITPVGVEANGEMEIPGATTIGWYEFGPRPGEDGSAVLAAHIAFDNERGVFRFLDDSVVGDTFELTFDDGSTVSYQLVERAQYDKDELPFDRVFAKDGPPVITLISCGGTFQQSISSYEDNIVAYAIPLS